MLAFFKVSFQRSGSSLHVSFSGPATRSTLVGQRLNELARRLLQAAAQQGLSARVHVLHEVRRLLPLSHAVRYNFLHWFCWCSNLHWEKLWDIPAVESSVHTPSFEPFDYSGIAPLWSEQRCCIGTALAPAESLEAISQIQ